MRIYSTQIHWIFAEEIFLSVVNLVLRRKPFAIIPLVFKLADSEPLIRNVLNESSKARNLQD